MSHATEDVHGLPIQVDCDDHGRVTLKVGRCDAELTPDAAVSIAVALDFAQLGAREVTR